MVKNSESRLDRPCICFSFEIDASNIHFTICESPAEKFLIVVIFAFNPSCSPPSSPQKRRRTSHLKVRNDLLVMPDFGNTTEILFPSQLLLHPSAFSPHRHTSPS